MFTTVGKLDQDIFINYVRKESHNGGGRGDALFQLGKSVCVLVSVKI